MEKKKYYLLIIILIMVICFIPNVYAHPGRTDSNGCHTCRTNCARWGLSYGEYHCHNGGSSNRTYQRTYVYGCTNSNAVNYNPNANVNDGSCIAKAYGCTDPKAYNYDPKANTDNGGCIARAYGCTDSNAYNYDPNANTDNGGCIAKVYGCKDKKANNYDYNANTNDGSCLYTKYKVKYKNIKYKTKLKYKLFYKKGTVIRRGKNGKKKITTKYIVDENGNVKQTFDDEIKIIKKPISKLVVTKTKK